MTDIKRQKAVLIQTYVDDIKILAKMQNSTFIFKNKEKILLFLLFTISSVPFANWQSTRISIIATRSQKCRVKWATRKRVKLKKNCTYFSSVYLNRLCLSFLLKNHWHESLLFLFFLLHNDVDSFTDTIKALPSAFGSSTRLIYTSAIFSTHDAHTFSFIYFFYGYFDKVASELCGNCSCG